MPVHSVDVPTPTPERDSPADQNRRRPPARALRPDHAALDGWPEALQLRQAEAAVDRLELAREPLEVGAAITLRLVRAHQTLALAGGLLRRGGSLLADFQALLACERFVPALRSPDDGTPPAR
jgi:hypothetical protein